MQLLKTILIVLLVFYGIKFLSRLLAPILLKRFTTKMKDRFQQQFNQYYQQQQDSPKKEVTIEKTQENKRSNSNDLGEYIDFEEIDEQK